MILVPSVEVAAETSVGPVPGTSIVPLVRTTTSQSVHGAQTPYSLTTETNRQSVTLADDIYFTQPQAVMSQPNETTRMSGAKSFYVVLQLSTTNTKLSPIVDLARNSVFCIANRLNSPTSSNTPRYVAETNASDTSNALDIRLTQAVRDSSEVEVYYRTTSADEVRNISDINWTAFNGDGSSDKTVTKSEADDDFREYQYSASNVNTFTAFQIKIVLKGTNSSYPPIVRDMRGIALAI